MNEPMLKIVVPKSAWEAMQAHLAELPYKTVKPLENIFGAMEITEAASDADPDEQAPD